MEIVPGLRSVRLLGSKSYLVVEDEITLIDAGLKRTARPATGQPPASVELRRALRVIDDSVDQYIDAARMKPAA